MKIGELSRASGLPVRTLRFYEAEGLLESRRTAGNYRDFPPSALVRVQQIRAYRALHLSLQEIRTMLRLSESPEHSCSAVCQLIQRHLGIVAEQRRRLQELETELERLLLSCSGAEPGPCKILTQLGPADRW